MLAKFKHAAIKISAEELDMTRLLDQLLSKEEFIYGKVNELLPVNATKHLGKYVLTSSYYYANLFYCIITRMHTRGILHFLNK